MVTADPSDPTRPALPGKRKVERSGADYLREQKQEEEQRKNISAREQVERRRQQESAFAQRVLQRGGLSPTARSRLQRVVRESRQQSTQEISPTLERPQETRTIRPYAEVLPFSRPGPTVERAQAFEARKKVPPSFRPTPRGPVSFTDVSGAPVSASILPTTSTSEAQPIRPGPTRERAALMQEARSVQRGPIERLATRIESLPKTTRMVGSAIFAPIGGSFLFSGVAAQVARVSETGPGRFAERQLDRISDFGLKLRTTYLERVLGTRGGLVAQAPGFIIQQSAGEARSALRSPLTTAAVVGGGFALGGPASQAQRAITRFGQAQLPVSRFLSGAIVGGARALPVGLATTFGTAPVVRQIQQSASPSAQRRTREQGLLTSQILSRAEQEEAAAARTQAYRIPGTSTTVRPIGTPIPMTSKELSLSLGGTLYGIAPITSQQEAVFERSVRKQLVQRGVRGQELDLATREALAERRYRNVGQVASQIAISASLGEIAGRSFQAAGFAGRQGLSFAQRFAIGFAGTAPAGVLEQGGQSIATSQLLRQPVRAGPLAFEAALGGLTAGLLGGFISATATSTSGVARGAGLATRGAVNIADPFELPGDVLANIGEAVGRVRGTRVLAPVVTFTPTTTITEAQPFPQSRVQLAFDTSLAQKGRRVNVPSFINTFTGSFTPSKRETVTPSFTPVPTPTDTNTFTYDVTFPFTPTPTETGTPTETETSTETSTETTTSTATATSTFIPTVTPQLGRLPPIFPPVFPFGSGGGTGLYAKQRKMFINELELGKQLIRQLTITQPAVFVQENRRRRTMPKRKRKKKR